MTIDELPILSSEEQVKLARELDGLLNTDARAAIARARILPKARVADGVTTEFMAASIFVDAGDELGDDSILAEGQEILERLCIAHPDHPSVLYCLANALTARTRLQRFADPRWFLDTREARQRARTCLSRAGRSNAPDELRAKALTNLGNTFWAAHRWVEAYDAYLDALAVDPTNAIARTGAVEVLLRAIKYRFGNREMLGAVATRHLERARTDRNRIVDLAGPAAAKMLDSLLAMNLSGGEYPDLSQAGPFERFVARNRLALSFTIEGLELDLKRWDSLHLKSITEPLDTPNGVPPVFAMFNVLKADYMAARWLAYVALNEQAPESGWYGDTLDYARYGVNVSLLSIAQRTSLDVLDKIAVFLAEYLDTKENPERITFRRRWHVKDKTGVLHWRPAVAAEIMAPNVGLIALADIAFDLDDGYLATRKQQRDTGTHRFWVIHDEGNNASRSSDYITHYGESEFESALLDTLRLSRAALIYLAEAVAWREARREKGKLTAPMIVPGHHWVRGGGDTDVVGGARKGDSHGS